MIYRLFGAGGHDQSVIAGDMDRCGAGIDNNVDRIGGDSVLGGAGAERNGAWGRSTNGSSLNASAQIDHGIGRIWSSPQFIHNLFSDNGLSGEKHKTVKMR